MTIEERVPPLAAGTALRHAETEAEVRACWPVMRQLRPRLKDADELVARVARMRPGGYRLLAAWQDDAAVALGGYRLQDNLIHDRFLYVDDLVTLDSARGRQWGARLIEAMTHIAEEAGCDAFVLDTALSNALAQRFYFRQGLLAGAMRFARPIARGVAA